LKLSSRQQKIIDIISEKEPIRSIDIADIIGVSQSTIRADLAILTSMGIVDGKQNQGYFYKNISKGEIQKNLKEIKVKDIMKEGITVKENESVYDASIKMILQDVSSLYVLNEKGSLVGVLSRKDLLKSAIVKGTDSSKIPISLAMTKQPLYKVTKEDNIELASKIIVEKEIDGLPVVEVIDGNEKLIGRITKTNISEIFVSLIER